MLLEKREWNNIVAESAIENLTALFSITSSCIFFIIIVIELIDLCF